MSERRKRVEKMRDGRSNQSERVTTFPLQAQLVRSGNQPTMASFQRYFPFTFRRIFHFLQNILFELKTRASAKSFVALSIETQ